VFGAKGFEPSTSWSEPSKTCTVKQSNALNRRRIAEQLLPLIGLLIGLQILKFRNEDCHRRDEHFITFSIAFGPAIFSWNSTEETPVKYFLEGNNRRGPCPCIVGRAIT
jgi:hypothetical protein